MAKPIPLGSWTLPSGNNRMATRHRSEWSPHARSAGVRSSPLAVLPCPSIRRGQARGHDGPAGVPWGWQPSRRAACPGFRSAPPRPGAHRHGVRRAPPVARVLAGDRRWGHGKRRSDPWHSGGHPLDRLPGLVPAEPLAFGEVAFGGELKQLLSKRSDARCVENVQPLVYTDCTVDLTWAEVPVTPSRRLEGRTAY